MLKYQLTLEFKSRSQGSQGKKSNSLPFLANTFCLFFSPVFQTLSVWYGVAEGSDTGVCNFQGHR